MSTILKALSRLEREQSGASKSAPPPEGPRRKPDRPRARSLWLALAIGGLLGFGGAALWTFSGPYSDSEPSSNPPPAPAANPAPRPPPPLASNPAARPPPMARAVDPTPARAATEPAPELAAAPLKPPALRPSAPEAAPAAPPPTRPAPRVAPPEPAPAPEATRETAPQPTPVPAPRPAAKAAPAPVAAAAAQPRPSAASPPAPADEPPQVARPTIPHVVVTSTQWHPDQARRTTSVELEGRDEPLQLRIGDAVGPLVVQRIDPSGVVFRMGDVEIRRRVGER